MAVFCGHVLGLGQGTVYHGGIQWTCIGLRPGDRVPWRYSVDMYKTIGLRPGDRVPWRYSVDMHIHVNPERSFRGTNDGPSSKARRALKWGSGVLPRKFSKTCIANGAI